MANRVGNDRESSEITNTLELRNGKIITNNEKSNNAESAPEVINNTQKETAISKKNTTTMDFLSVLLNPPEFHASEKEDIEEFLDHFNNCIESAELEDKSKIAALKNKLRGKAYTFVAENKNIRKITNYEEFCTKLKENFQKRTDFNVVQNTFDTIRQKDSESVNEFVNRLDTAATNYLEATQSTDKQEVVQFVNKLKAAKFIQGLQTHIRVDVKKVNPSSLAEAIKIAKNIEQAFEDQDSFINTINKSSAETKLVENLLSQQIKANEKIDELTKEISRLKAGPAREERTRIKNCDICHKGNHSTQECWFNNQLQWQHNTVYATEYQHRPMSHFPRQRAFQEVNHNGPRNRGAWHNTAPTRGNGATRYANPGHRNSEWASAQNFRQERNGSRFPRRPNLN